MTYTWSCLSACTPYLPPKPLAASVWEPCLESSVWYSQPTALYSKRKIVCTYRLTCTLTSSCLSLSTPYLPPNPLVASVWDECFESSLWYSQPRALCVNVHVARMKTINTVHILIARLHLILTLFLYTILAPKALWSISLWLVLGQLFLMVPSKGTLQTHTVYVHVYIKGTCVQLHHRATISCTC